jgi:hypothetical protein
MEEATKHRVADILTSADRRQTQGLCKELNTTIEEMQPPWVKDGLIEPTPNAHIPEGIYIARIQARGCREVPVKVTYAANHDQILAKGFSLENCEPITLVTPLGAPHPQMQ